MQSRSCELFTHFSSSKLSPPVEVLRDTRWVLGGDNGAAVRLRMPRTTLIYKMRKLGIAREQGSKSFQGRLDGLTDSPQTSVRTSGNNRWAEPKE